MIASDHQREPLRSHDLSFLAGSKSTGLLQINTNYEITNWWR